MKWFSVKHKPKLGQKCLCYYVMERRGNSTIEDFRILYYLKFRKDNRKRVFSDKDEHGHDFNIGGTDWPVTHWLPLSDNLKPTTKQEEL